MIKDFIKKNKNKIIISSCILSGIVVSSSIAGIVSTVVSNNISNQAPLVKPGEIKFDSNGKLLIPIIKDPQNPSGNYKFKTPKITETIVPEVVKQSSFFKTGLPKILSHNKEQLLSRIRGDLTQKVNTNKDFKMFIDNIIPNNNIAEGQEISVEQTINELYMTASNNAKTNILTSQQISDMCAINGININQAYNEAYEQSKKSSNVYGGGIRPPAIPDINTNFPENCTFNDVNEIIKQDYNVRYGFAIAYSVLLPVVTAAEIICSIFTFGISIAIAALDVTFCAIEIANAWDEYYEAYSGFNMLVEVWDLSLGLISDEIFNKIEYSKFGQKGFLIKKNIDNFLVKMGQYNTLIKLNFAAIESLFSWLSIAVEVGMPILEILIRKIING